MALAPKICDAVTTVSHEWGFSFPSKHLALSASYRAQSLQFNEILVQMMAFILSALPAFIASYSGQNLKASELRLSPDGKSFLISVRGEKSILPIAPEVEESPEAAVFRKDKTWIVWDDRGLVIRNDISVFSTKFEAITTSPKAFKYEEILKNIEGLKDGKLSRIPSRLAGSVRFGNQIYFLPRWENTDGKPWLEALFCVDLSESPPRPKYVGKFTGFTQAYKPIDNEIFLEGDKVGVVTNQGESWGVSTVKIGTSDFENEILGSNLKSYLKGGLFVESSSYGTSLIGRINFKTLIRRNLAEIRGLNYNFLPSDPEILWVQKGDNCELNNLSTGAVWNLPGTFQVRSNGKQVVVWNQEFKLKTAFLVDPKRWTLLARLKSVVVKD